MLDSSQRIHKYISKGDFQNAYLIAEEEYKKSPGNLDTIKSFVELICKINQKPLLKKAEQIIRNSKYDVIKHPDLSFLLMQIYTSLGDVEKVKNHKKQCEKEFGYIDAKTNELENIENISHLHTEDLSLDEFYYNEQLVQLVKYLLEENYKDSKELKKTYNLLKNNYIEDGYYILKIFAQNLEDKSMSQFILAELALVDEKFDIAEKWYNKIINKVNNKGIVYNRLGDICFARGENDKALQYYSKSYDHNPDDENTNLDLIRTHVINKNIAEAKKIYIRASDKFGRENTQNLKDLISNKVIKNNKNYVNGLVVCIDDSGKSVDGFVNRIYFKSKKSNFDEVIISGNLSFLAIESIKISESLLYEHYQEKLNKSIKVIFEHSISMADGNSAGLATIIGLIALAKNKKIPNTTAFTGAVNYNGEVKKIGGLDRKLMSAYIYGIKTVYIPEENFSDLHSIDAKVKSNLSIKIVKHYKDVVRHIWN